MPLVSVIMPSYNHAPFIGGAMESVLSQDYGDLELIVIDDASVDDSRHVIESWQGRDSRIRPIFHAANQGIARTVNHGLDEARGEWVAFLSSDDLWVDGKLHKQLDVLERNEDLIVCSDALVIDGEGNVTETARYRHKHAVGLIPSAQMFELLLTGNFVAGHSMMLKRRNLDGIRYDERLKYLNDWKIVLDLASRYDFHFTPECLVKYRLHGGNSISRDPLGWLDDYGILGQYILTHYGDRMPRKTRGMFMYRVGCREHWQGNRRGGRWWMLKAIAAHPFRSEYYGGLLGSFLRHCIVPKAIQRRVRQ